MNETKRWLLEWKKCQMGKKSHPELEEVINVQEEIYLTKLAINLEKLFPGEKHEKIIPMILQKNTRYMYEEIMVLS